MSISFIRLRRDGASLQTSQRSDKLSMILNPREFGKFRNTLAIVSCVFAVLSRARWRK
jgi:hypothetical protein